MQELIDWLEFRIECLEKGLLCLNKRFNRDDEVMKGRLLGYKTTLEFIKERKLNAK